VHPPGTDILFVATDRPSRIPAFHLGFTALLQGLHAARPDLRVDYVDLNLESVRGAMDVGRLVAARRPRALAFSPIFTKDVPRVLAYARAVRTLSPQTRIVVGGYHVTAEPLDLMGSPDIDLAVRGQALNSLDIFSQALAPQPDPLRLAEIPGACWKAEGEVRVGAAARLVRGDVAGHQAVAPFRIPIDRHPVLRTVLERTFHGFNRNPMPLLFAIGCPKPCGFCSIAQTADGNPLSKGGIYYRSPEDVVADMRWYGAQGVDTFSFVDDNFTANKKAAKAFCRLLIASGLRVEYDFTSGLRIDSLDRELVELMVESGCRGWGFGIEAGSQRVRERLMRKEYGPAWTNERFTERLAEIREWSAGRFLGSSGMTVPFIIMGYPGVDAEAAESVAEMDESIDLIGRWCREGLITAAHWSIFIPLPGTEVWHQLSEEHRAIYRENFEWFNVEDARHLAAVIGGQAGRIRGRIVLEGAWRALLRHRPGWVAHLPLPAAPRPSAMGAELLELKQMEGVWTLLFARSGLRDGLRAASTYLAPGGVRDLRAVRTRTGYVFHKLMSPG
jgi:radical SAM superfamily enzyme YgiQ (UPF0313 family)